MKFIIIIDVIIRIFKQKTNYAILYIIIYNLINLSV